jgi:hypothetical protein
VEELLSRILDAHKVRDIIQIKQGTAEPLLPAPRHLVIEIYITNLEIYKSAGSHQILAELFQALDEN